MKRSAISGLIITAVFLASPAFADDMNLCTSNLTQLNNSMSDTISLDDGAMNQLKTLKEGAEKDKAAGKAKDCIDKTTEALKVLEDSMKGGKG
ncbi:hypothetical protein [Pseudomonas akapageensis]|uniref:hypothetical protein n=1 Tax=Pseudomonas akapageensis TaxID=2609961 RepID=UPI00140826C0|nr:hypothetical protein [Pseudomonas akapageensis]